MSRSLRFVSVVPWLLISACCTPGQHPPAAGTRAEVPVATAASPVAGSVPQEIVTKMRADLAQQVGADAAASARVVAAEHVDWPNGAMGCPQPGRMYTQAIVPGYRVEFEAGGKTYAYHGSEKGGFALCQQPAAGASPSSQQLR